jgi:hypothetical protein
MISGIWNISLYRAGSLVTVSKYTLDLVGVQEIRCKAVEQNKQENAHIYGKENEMN